MTNELEDHLVNKIGLPVIYPSQSTQRFKPGQSNKKLGMSPEQRTSSKRIRVQSYKIIEKNYE